MGVEGPDVEPLRVRLLGPVRVDGPDGPAALVGARQRALVGLLALTPGVVLSRARLVDALYGDDPPRTAVRSLHSHIARARQALAGCGLPNVLATREPGYLLDLDPAQVDAGRFEALARDARRLAAGGDPGASAGRLRAALALWRGDPFSDAELAGWGPAEVRRLEEVRLAAVEDLWDAELRLGRHLTAAEELSRLLVRHPAQERLVGLHMLALYRCGRHAEALASYQRLRQRLADELGVDPGRELQQLHVAMLRRDRGLDAEAVEAVPARPAAPRRQPAAPRPAQLPLGVGHFTGRAGPLAELDRALAEGDVPIAVVCGPAGMGKTALAVHWAHGVAGRFPDGQLFLDLRGHDPAIAMRPSEVLAQLLSGLGVPADRLPASLPERTALYRSLTNDQRLLVVCDNAGRYEDLLPLVPASAGTLLLVTSRHRLAALATYHAVRSIDLDTLPAQDAVALVGRVLGPRRVAQEAAAVAELVELCDRMPLALRIIAARLAVQPGTRIQDMVAELAGAGRLDALGIDGSRSVRAVFATAYQGLSPAAAGLFRRLGLHPGPTFTARHGAAATGLPLAQAERALAELVTGHLVGPEGGDAAAGRYRFHDLLRLYAQECARLDEGPARCAEVLERLLEWYLAIAAGANRVLDPGRDRVQPQFRHPAPELPFGPDRPEALAFLDGERDNLLRVVQYAAGHGHDVVAWQLAYLLTAYFDSRGHWTERVELCRDAVAAAHRLGDPATEGLMCSALGVAYVVTRRFDEALEQLRPALALMRAGGDVRGEGHVQNNLAVAYIGLRRWDEAAGTIQQALALHTANAHQVGIALALNNLGHVHAKLGRLDAGLARLQEALTLARQLGKPWLEAAVLHTTGQAHLDHGRPRPALQHFGQALALQRQIGDRMYEAETLHHLGLTHLALGDHAAGLMHFRRALELSTKIADAHLEALALAGIGTAYLAADRLDEAREYLLLALATRGRAPDPFEQAELHRTLGDLEAAALRERIDAAGPERVSPAPLRPQW